MRFNRIFAIIPLVLVTACSGLSYVIENYSSVEMQQFTYADETWRIFDKPNENKLMITPSMGSAMAGGAKTGLTLGLAGNQGDPENRFRTAAMMFVKQKEGSCVIIEGKLLINPQYEYTYKC